MKYIEAEKLKERITKLEADSCISEYKDGFDDGVGCVLDIIDSLQQEQMEINETEVVESEATINGVKTKLNIIVFVVPDDWKPGDKVESIITRKEE